MNKEEVYSVWAPDGCEWSPWVKPVLFAFLLDDQRAEADAENPEFASSFPPADSDTFLVADLPGPRGISLGLRLAGRGYRPIPLYNALPQPSLPASSGLLQTLFSGDSSTRQIQPVVDVLPLIYALRRATEELRTLRIPLDAPPVFLLDSRRRGAGNVIPVGMFDNRSVTFPSDFPSAEFLKGRGMRNVVVVQEGQVPEFDLALVLREWETGGLNLSYQAVGLRWDPQPLRLPEPSWLRRLWFWVQSHLDLQRHPDGGYGAIKQGSSG
jgi:hypothetical protein